MLNVIHKIDETNNVIRNKFSVKHHPYGGVLKVYTPVMFKSLCFSFKVIVYEISFFRTRRVSNIL